MPLILQGSFHELTLLHNSRFLFAKDGERQEQTPLGFPTVAQRVKNPASIWIRSVASLSGLRIQHCQELRHRSQMQLGSCVAVAVVYSTPCPGTSICCSYSPKKKKKGKNKNKNQPISRQVLPVQ